MILYRFWSVQTNYTAHVSVCAGADPEIDHVRVRARLHLILTLVAVGVWIV